MGYTMNDSLLVIAFSPGPSKRPRHNVEQGTGARRHQDLRRLDARGSPPGVRVSSVTPLSG